MQLFQTSLFYDLQELIENSPLLRKYYYLFQALNLSAMPDKNDGQSATGYRCPPQKLIFDSKYRILVIVLEILLIEN